MGTTIDEKNVPLYLEIMHILASDLGTKILFYHDRDDVAQGLYDGKTIYLNAAFVFDNENTLFSVFFHELTHREQHITGQYKFDYDNMETMNKRPKQTLKIERSVDKRAAKIMVIYFPELEYQYAY